jgi:hypothetical protein
MLKNIAHRLLTVNGGPSPCECNETTVCAFCVQANLILWSKKQEEETLPLVDRISKNGIRKTARSLRVEHSTVLRWVKKGRIPSKYKQKLYSQIGEGGA